MGIGNLTELTEADTTGVTALLIGFCQELGIRNVLTTEVIDWARGAVREAVLAAQLMHFAQQEGTPPKHVDGRLLTIKDEEVRPYTEAELRELHASITDPNFRIFTDADWIYAFNAERFVKGTDINADLRRARRRRAHARLLPGQGAHEGVDRPRAGQELPAGVPARLGLPELPGVLRPGRCKSRRTRGLDIRSLPRLTMCRGSAARGLGAAGSTTARTRRPIDLGSLDQNGIDDGREVVSRLKARGFTLSSIARPARAPPGRPGRGGPVLSLNGMNRDGARELGATTVVIPTPRDVESSTDGRGARARGRPFRIDPILEPIGFGFAASLGRYLEVRAAIRRRDADGDRQPDRADRRRLGGGQHPPDRLLPGAGRRERPDDRRHQLGPVAVREVDVARQLMYARRAPGASKRIDDRLLTIKDQPPRPKLHRARAPRAPPQVITDPNFRIATDPRRHLRVQHLSACS